MLHFDIDTEQLLQAGDELGASEKQVLFALTRAMRRTEATLRRMSSQGLSRILQLRAASAIRKRLRSINVRYNASRGGSFGLWYGLNPLPVSSFKGRVTKTSDGASARGENFKGAFVGRSHVKGRRTIFRRASGDRLPITEQMMPIEDRAIVFIEDEVFEQVEEIFWQHFKRDLQARVRFHLGER